MQSIHTLISICLVLLVGCQSQTTQDQPVKNDLDIKAIDIDHWDQQSQINLSTIHQNDFSKLNYAQKKAVIETLIAHQHQDYAIPLFEHMKKNSSQYLRFLQATAYYQNNQVEAALAILTPLATDSTEMSNWHLKLSILLELGQADEVISIHQKHHDSSIFDSSLSRYYAAMAFLQNRQCDQAAELFLQVLQQQPQATSVYIPLSKSQQQCQQTQAAQESRSKAGSEPLQNSDEFPNRLLKNGNPAEHYKQLLNSAMVNKDITKIAEVTDKLVQLKVADAQMLTNLAIIRFRSGQLQQANAALDVIIKKEPNHIKSHELMYEFNKATNKTIAQKAVDKLLSLSPENATYQQAQLYLSQ